eukprot:Platyproteum_vivax@DN6062_c0_g1_i3.p1
MLHETTFFDYSRFALCNSQFAIRHHGVLTFEVENDWSCVESSPVLERWRTLLAKQILNYHQQQLILYDQESKHLSPMECTDDADWLPQFLKTALESHSTLDKAVESEACLSKGTEQSWSSYRTAPQPVVRPIMFAMLRLNARLKKGTKRGD